MKGTIGILNVGAGDTKLTFDKSNPAECIRSGRIVIDMLRRGYALLIEDPPGSGTYTRVKKFDENTSEYIIADFDGAAAQRFDEAEEHAQAELGQEAAANSASEPAEEPRPAGLRKRGRPEKKVPASSTTGIAVARSAGG
jgi:hypothetical protein